MPLARTKAPSKREATRSRRSSGIDRRKAQEYNYDTQSIPEAAYQTNSVNSRVLDTTPGQQAVVTATMADEVLGLERLYPLVPNPNVPNTQMRGLPDGVRLRQTNIPAGIFVMENFPYSEAYGARRVPAGVAVDAAEIRGKIGSDGISGVDVALLNGGLLPGGNPANRNIDPALLPAIDVDTLSGRIPDENMPLVIDHNRLPNVQPSKLPNIGALNGKLALGATTGALGSGRIKWGKNSVPGYAIAGISWSDVTGKPTLVGPPALQAAETRIRNWVKANFALRTHKH